MMCLRFLCDGVKFASVKVQLYSPERPLVDIAEVFLWLMAVGTIICASYWSAWSAREAAIEQDKLLKVILYSIHGTPVFSFYAAGCFLNCRHG